MKIRVAFMGAAVLLSACAGEVIEKGMSQMVGKPLSAVTAKLGFPDEERIIAGRKVYIWLTSTMREGTERKCQIRVIMRGDVIDDFDFEGSNILCRYYASQLQS